MIENKRGRQTMPGQYGGGKRRLVQFLSETQIVRAREDFLALGGDPIMATHAGRLHVLGHLSAHDLSIVDYIAKTYGRFEYYHAPARRRTHSPAYEAGIARSATSGPQNEIAARSASEEWRELQRAIEIFPSDKRCWLERLCVDNEHVPLNCIAEVKVMLEVVANEIRGEPDSEPRKPKLEQRVAAGEFAWRAEGAGPGTSEGREAKIINMLDRLRAKELAQ